MLRLCLTLSVLLRLQVAGIGVRDLVEESCESIICYPFLNIIVYDDYEEIDLPPLPWLSTFINGTDLKTATNFALDRFFDYSHYNNTADAIVPISAPWTAYIPLENGIMKPEFIFSVSLPLEVQIPPEPKDPSVHLSIDPPMTIYASHWITERENEDYLALINELKTDLEKDQRSFNSSGVYIEWFNTRGHIKVIFLKK